MQILERLVEIDRWQFRVQIHAEQESVAVFSSDQCIEFRPWTLVDHLAALAVGVRGPHADFVRLASHEDESDFGFDREAFANEVLLRSGKPSVTLTDEFQSLALWWAAGGVQANSQHAPAEYRGDWLVLGEVEVWLRPWSWAERARVLASGSHEAVGEDVVTYIYAMLRTCVRACRRCPSDGEPRAVSRDEIWSLTGMHIHQLIDAVLESNRVSDKQDTWMQEDPQLAADTLWLCQTFGWTPGQVWQTPAHEIDRLLQLRHQVQRSHTPRTPLTSSLASHPDAVVIHVGDA